MEPHMGLDLMTHEIMAWAKTKSQMLNWLSHLGTPDTCLLYTSDAADDRFLV